MLRLIIVDDERIIRESIRNFIDWESIGVEVIASCSNGLEAYDAILDDYPDIVLTDIKMPGLSGLELIERLYHADATLEFIILSGYDDFAYARQAMKYGVRSYLLKPCNEEDIIQAVKSAALRRQQTLLQSQAFSPEIVERIKKNVVRSIISEAMARHVEPSSLTNPYQYILDFAHTSYCLHHIHFLSFTDLPEILRQIHDFLHTQSCPVTYWALYTQYTLTLFFSEDEPCANDFSQYLDTLRCPNAEVALVHRSLRFAALTDLLTYIFKKLSRYPTIYYINDLNIIEICNYNSMFQAAMSCAEQLEAAHNDSDWNNACNQLRKLIEAINDQELLMTLIIRMLIRHNSENDLSRTPIVIADFLREIEAQSTPKQTKEFLFEHLAQLFPLASSPAESSWSFIDRMLRYTWENLDKPDLSLKQIANQVLFMNVDYLSKQFIRHTGKKFSSYLNEMRIERAKQLMNSDSNMTMYAIAEQVGYGNNPQYFSQWFKKHTGMAPTVYLQQIKNEKNT